MKLSEVCIKRPVLAWVMTFILILLGIVGGSRLPLQQYPTMARPYVTIETNLPGAGPEIVEAQVTRVVEEAISGIEGVVSITSTSATEDSKVVLEIRGDRRVAEVLNDVRDRLNKFKDRLPDEATEPTLTKSRAEDKPIITLALTSEELDTGELADFAIRELQKDLESAPGVARADVLGAGQYVMHIFLDPVKLAAYKISVADVMRSLKRQNVEKPAGKLIGLDREYLVTTVANLETPEEFNEMVIDAKEDHLTRLKDIGHAEVTSEDHRTKTRYNGKPGVSIGIIKQSDSNPIEVARGVKEMLPDIKRKLPSEVEIHIGSDKTLYIEKSIKEVYWTIGEATFLVILVVIVFLRSARASIIPLVTIPVSLIGALFLMYLLNFSINVLTLMAMVLAIGLVVDDAIVMLENIYRYIEKGMKPFEAAVKGVREISFAIIAMTLTLAAVYAPISLSKGLIGRIFTEFALTLAGAVVISGFAALTLSPMMCARMLKHSKDDEVDDVQNLSSWAKFKLLLRTDIWLDHAEEAYDKALKVVIRRRGWVSFCGLLFALLGAAVYFTLPREMTPQQDQGRISIEGQAPQASTLEYTNRYIGKLDDILKGIPEIDRRVLQINNPTFDASIQLNENRKRQTQEIVDYIRQGMDGIIGIEARIDAAGGGISGEKGNTVEFVIQGNKSYREIKEIARRVTYYIYRSNMVNVVRSEIRGETTDFIVTILRDVAASLRIEPMSISDTIDALIRGRKATSFKRNNQLYDVKVEVEDRDRQTPHDITNLYMKAGDRDETLVPLSELVRVTSRSGPIEIRHHNRMRSITLSASLKKGLSLNDGIESVRRITDELLPQDARMEFVGETKRYLRESKSMYLIFGLALAFIYLVMAAQFESWRDPFIIILSVPLSLAGAVITLALIERGSLNLYSQIGLVTLIGLITKHGIMMVDFSNKLREQGLERAEAVIKACKLRLRPILMTTFAMVLGAVPLAYASGAGAEARRQIGWVVVGGMSIGTLFTLFVLPAVYMFLSKKIRKPTIEVSIQPVQPPARRSPGRPRKPAPKKPTT